MYHAFFVLPHLGLRNGAQRAALHRAEAGLILGDAVFVILVFGVVCKKSAKTASLDDWKPLEASVLTELSE